MANQSLKTRARRVFDPIVSALASAGVPPMLVSILALVFSLYGAGVVAKGSLFWGGFWLVVAGICDILDGDLARRRGVESKFGAFIDSTFDRITELAYFGGILFYFVSRPQGYSPFNLTVLWIAMSGSILISYARARVEGLGYTGNVGFMERPERLMILIAGLLLGSRMLMFALFVLALGTSFTVLQRIYHAYKVTKENESSARQ